MKLRQYARENRKNPTEAERRLWFRLRNRQLLGWKFRRQVPMGSYIVDFFCLDAKLVLELDGSQHLLQAEYDAERTSYLQSRGYRVVRFFNDQVLEDMDQVLEQIVSLLSGPSPQPSPIGRGG